MHDSLGHLKHFIHLAFRAGLPHPVTLHTCGISTLYFTSNLGPSSLFSENPKCCWSGEITLGFLSACPGQITHKHSLSRYNFLSIAMPAKNDSLFVRDSRTQLEYEIPINDNFVSAVDFKKIKDASKRSKHGTRGLVLYDHGLQNTAIKQSRISFS